MTHGCVLFLKIGIVREKLASIKNMPIEEVKIDLSDYSASTEGSEKALRERLFRAWYIKLNGATEVPWIAGADFYFVPPGSEGQPLEYTMLDRRSRGSRSDEIEAELKKKGVAIAMQKRALRALRVVVSSQPNTTLRQR